MGVDYPLYRTAQYTHVDATLYSALPSDAKDRACNVVWEIRKWKKQDAMNKWATREGCEQVDEQGWRAIPQTPRRPRETTNGPLCSFNYGEPACSVAPLKVLNRNWLRRILFIRRETYVDLSVSLLPPSRINSLLPSGNIINSPRRRRLWYKELHTYLWNIVLYNYEASSFLSSTYFGY